MLALTGSKPVESSAKSARGNNSPKKKPPTTSALMSAFSLLALVIDLANLASLISFGALVPFPAVNQAVVKTHLLDNGAQRNLKGAPAFNGCDTHTAPKTH